MRDALGRLAQLAAVENFLGCEVQFDDAVKTHRRGEIEDRIRLRLGQYQRGGVRLLQVLEATEQPDLGLEVEGWSDGVQPHGLEKELLTLAGKKLAVRRNRA